MITIPEKSDPISWEHVHYNSNDLADNYLSRLKVPGGWILKSEDFVMVEDLGEYLGSQSMCFLPDPNYNWKL